MENSQRELLSLLEDLRSDVDEMRLRLAAVEAQVGLRATPGVAQPGAGDEQSTILGSKDEVEPQAATLAPLLGWAFLATSGAYLLRAITESGSIPVLAGVIAGILYAGWWLFLAAARAASKPLASTVYGVVAVVVLAPLLYEAVVRYRVLSGPAAGIVLVAFTIFGLTIAWHHNITSVACVATLAGLFTPMALFRETHQGEVWAASVLAIAAAVEFSACRDHWLGLRWVAALVADGTILLLTVLATTRHASPNESAFASSTFILGAQVALLFIYLASTADRTLFRKLPITSFEIGQALAAFLVSVGGALRLADITMIGWMPVGVFCLAAGAAYYGISFALVDRHTQPSRNFYTYSTFGLLLSASGCRLLIAGDRVAIAWALLALCTLAAGILAGRRTLRVHAGVLLIAGAVAASVFGKSWAAVMNWANAGSLLSDANYFAVLFAAPVLYVTIVVIERASEGGAAERTEAFVPAAVFAWSTAGVVCSAVGQATTSSAPVRTAVLALSSLAIAWAGVRGGRTELVWLAYAFLAAAGLKFFLEDARTGGSISLVVSLSLFGLTLILLPRIVRFARTPAGTSERSISARAGS